MYDYRYVTKNEAAPYKEDLRQLIYLVQDEVRDDFTFQFTPVGSSSPDRNMITCLRNGNIGFDFDYNIEPNPKNNNTNPAFIRNRIYEALRKHAGKFGYTNIEESTSVITIKAVDRYRSRILFSCDFAIVHHYNDNGVRYQQYIRYNKGRNTYSWEDRGKGFYIEHKIEWLKKNGYWNNLRDYYIEKKNCNEDPNKHSRSLLAEAVNEKYSKYHG